MTLSTVRVDANTGITRMLYGGSSKALTTLVLPIPGAPCITGIYFLAEPSLCLTITFCNKTSFHSSDVTLGIFVCPDFLISFFNMSASVLYAEDNFPCCPSNCFLNDISAMPASLGDSNGYSELMYNIISVHRLGLVLTLACRSLNPMSSSLTVSLNASTTSGCHLTFFASPTV